VAQAGDFVEHMPDPSRPRSARAGFNVSGGQRQHFSIARALVKKSRIYIFDDSFSALDVATDARLRHALKGQRRSDSAVIIVGNGSPPSLTPTRSWSWRDGAVVGAGDP